MTLSSLSQFTACVCSIHRDSMTTFHSLWETFPDENCVLTKGELLRASEVIRNNLSLPLTRLFIESNKKNLCFKLCGLFIWCLYWLIMFSPSEHNHAEATFWLFLSHTVSVQCIEFFAYVCPCMSFYVSLFCSACLSGENCICSLLKQNLTFSKFFPRHKWLVCVSVAKNWNTNT